VAELAVCGVDTVKLLRPEQPISRVPTAVAAFVGRTLKGPVDQPVTLASFSDFQRVFGGLWQPSTLSYAVEQFFENGGRQCIVVRVANGGRPPSITLPAGNSTLTLIGLAPGTREFLRGSVDYDGIDDKDTTSFNLVLQRLRAPGSEFIEDQEIFRCLSIVPGLEHYVADALAESRLARMVGKPPPNRPDRSIGASGAVGYAGSNTDGDDGDVLSDYDLVGHELPATGLFALRGVEHFNLLCLPPLARDHDVGLPALLIALRLCRERHAMLVVDPPRAWTSAAAALEGLKEWPFRSEDALMYFPRITAFDRLRGRFECFASCGAAAGMFARADEAGPPWAVAEGEDTLMRPNLRPAVVVHEIERQRLAQCGVNVLQGCRTAVRAALSPRTLVPENGVKSDGRYLSARRFALFVTASIEGGTRWVVFENSAPPLWERVGMQVTAFLRSLESQGAFVGRCSDENFFVICDDRLNSATETAQGTFKLLFGFASLRPGDFQAWLVTHQAGASRTRAVSVNRLALSLGRLETEFQTGLLRAI